MKNIFDRFECERLDDEYSFYQCIKEQKTGSRVECRECPEGREHKEYFRRQHAAMKAKSEEAKGMNKCKACPECGKQATSNVQRTCECGHQFYREKIGGGKTVAGEKKLPKAKKTAKQAPAPQAEQNDTTIMQKSKAIADDIVPEKRFELSIIATDKAHALKILEVAMGYGAGFGGWRVTA